MKKFEIKTKAEFEQIYVIEAETQEEAESIALSNVKDVVSQTQVSNGEIIRTIEANYENTSI